MPRKWPHPELWWINLTQAAANPECVVPMGKRTKEKGCKKVGARGYNIPNLFLHTLYCGLTSPKKTVVNRPTIHHAVRWISLPPYG